jgi:preprotein translocase subunit SecG
MVKPWHISVFLCVGLVLAIAVVTAVLLTRRSGPK